MADDGGQRPPLVGRRFLCVSGSHPLKLSRVYDWDWQAGWIRAATSLNPRDSDIQVGRAHEIRARTLYTDCTYKSMYNLN